jgi:SAM-dependent methyltransferase
MVKSASMAVPAPSSITHQHLLSVIASEMRARSTLSIVDVGCGGGALMKYLRSAFPYILPNCKVQVSGFDLSDFAPHGNSNLAPETETVRTGEPWPYADHSIDVIVSNQVLEHVFDQQFFFQQVARCLRPDGVSIHLFPLKNVIYEDHVGIPLAHRIPRPGWIRFMARLGFFSAWHANSLPGIKTGEFGECAADYIKKYTIYVSQGELKRSADVAGLALSFDYTPRFYTAKLRAVRKVKPTFFYPKTPLLDTAAFWVARYISSVTVMLKPIQDPTRRRMREDK